MKTWKKKTFIGILAILTLIATACTPRQSETQPQAQVENETTLVQPQISTEGETTQSQTSSEIFEMDSNSKKLIEEMYTINDGLRSSINFEYDNKNRIVKYVSLGMGGDGPSTITYNGDDLVKVVYVFVNDSDQEEITEKYFARSGNIITVTYNHGIYTETITLDNNGYIIKLEGANIYGGGVMFSYEYSNGNLTKRTWHNWYSDIDQSIYIDQIIEYQYDNRMSPFFQNETPKWYLVYSFSDQGVALRNNIISQKTTDNHSYEFNYEYEYDGDGYPIVQSSENWRRTFTYRENM